MRFIFNLLVIALFGLALGGGSAWYSIQQAHRFGALSVGPWTAFVYNSANDVDPYTVARSAAEGNVPLGATEGLTFEALTDSAGRELDRACRYRIEGATPPAKLWTLAAYDETRKQVPPAPGGTSAHYSNAILRFSDGSFLISAAPWPQSGNWLAISGKGPFHLVLRLYDTPLVSSGGLAQPQMPIIERQDCLR